MPRIKSIITQRDSKPCLKTGEISQSLLQMPQLNKGTAFGEEEREQLGLRGKLPYHIETLEQQVARVYHQFLREKTPLQKLKYLRGVYAMNETLFYKCVSQYLIEMLPILYTPTIGAAVERFSQEFQRPHGLYIAYPDRDSIEKIIENHLKPDVDIVIMTDGEGVLGIGDQGIGGIDICVAKLMVYVLCARIHPKRLLPIQIDVGTNNVRLLNDPMYLGWRHTRLKRKEYDEMVQRLISAIQRKQPKIYLHWEDFGQENARRNLERYRNTLCSFNDDMQGTGVVALAALLSAFKLTKLPLKNQRVVIVGAGTAGTGIADQIVTSMKYEGLSKEEALSQLYLVGKQGLLHDGMTDLNFFQKPYARSMERELGFNRTLSFEEVIKKYKPTVLIGCSGQGGLFTETIVRSMAEYVENPIIFPLSNPTEKSEANPQDLITWTQGRALIATGSPFNPVEFHGKKISIAQCNNALIYPGIGLGVIAAKPKCLTESMLRAAYQALSYYINESDLLKNRVLLPSFEDPYPMSRCIALAVAEQARRDGLSLVDETIDFSEWIDRQAWFPEYEHSKS